MLGQGVDRTILDFGTATTQGNGIDAISDDFLVQDLTVLDAPKDGIRVEASNGVVFRRIRLAEAFPVPAHPRLFPANLTERARARQIMLFLRTSLFALREARPTSTVFGLPVTTPMPDQAKQEAAELERIALAVIPEGRTTMFADWCIADCDLALALMRLVANRDPLDRRLIDYAMAQFDRKSVQRFVSHLPTSR